MQVERSEGEVGVGRVIFKEIVAENFPGIFERQNNFQIQNLSEFWAGKIQKIYLRQLIRLKNTKERN